MLSLRHNRQRFAPLINFCQSETLFASLFQGHLKPVQEEQQQCVQFIKWLRPSS
jgi:hypothetical protein